MRVLLVEDHADTRELFATYLTALGLTVDKAVTGLQAVDMAMTHPPDVIVLDMGLPGMDGWTAARHLRSNPKTTHVPIVGCSARAFPDDERRAKEAGCDVFLTKPCLPSDVLHAIHQVTSRPPSEDGADGAAC
jgi:two-component system, cell cycle response regulator DivK